MSNRHPRGSASLQPGTMLSHYRIERKLGSGGMGEVYLAEDSSLQRTVAIKILGAEAAADSAMRRRFETEANSLAAISHPNVAVIHETGVFRERPFFVMEYIDGGSLETLLEKGPLPVDRIVDIGMQLCDGLSAVHGAGLIHRDIKPANILIDGSGRVRLVDFGIAYTVEDRQEIEPETLVGTIACMSPEQITGGELSVRSDLYSLGVVLYRMATGRKPFAGEYQAAVEYAIVNEAPKPVRNIRDEIPAELDALVRRLLSKNPDDRPADCVAVREELAGLTSKAGPEGRPNGDVGSSRRTSLITALVVLAAAIVVIGLTLMPWPGKRAKRTASITVLPFQNLGDPDDDYFSEGMTDAVITRLAGIQNLRVISRRSSMQYKASDMSIRDIGLELGTDFVVTGTIYWDKSQDPDQVRINARLIRAKDESYLWGETYDRVLDRIFDLQSDIAGQVTSVLKVAISEAERESFAVVPTANFDAYDFYLRGNYYFNRSWDQSDIMNATEMYTRAVALDSTFAAAQAMLARGHESMYWEYFDRSEDRCRLARQAASHAVELRPDLAEGHLALGYIYYHCEQDYEKALDQFQFGLRSQPNHADLYSAVAAVQRRQGKLTEAVDNFTLSLAVDPRSHLKAFDVALTCGMMREFDRAREYLEITLTLAPDWPLPYIYRAWIDIFQSGDTAAAGRSLAQATGRADIASSRYYWWLARIVESDYETTLERSRPGSDTTGFLLHCARLYRLMGRTSEEYRYADSARALLERKIQSRPDDPRFQSQLGLAYAGLRMKSEALAHGQRAVQLLPATRDAFDALFLMVNLAEILVIFGEHEAAIDQLELLTTIPGFISPPYLRLDPLWEPLRSSPRFRALLTRG